MPREFYCPFYEIAGKISEKMAAGIAEVSVMRQVGDWDFSRFCLMELRQKCPEYWHMVPAVFLHPIAQLVVEAMIRQHELDGGNVRTLWSAEPRASRAKAEAEAE